jgi:hypothetical protein
LLEAPRVLSEKMTKTFWKVRVELVRIDTTVNSDNDVDLSETGNAKVEVMSSMSVGGFSESDGCAVMKRIGDLLLK